MRLTSLRNRLIGAVWLALAGVGLASSAFAYWQARSDARELLDAQMAQVAHLLARESFPAASPSAVAPGVNPDEDPEDALEVAVRDAAGRLEYASTPGRPLPAREQPGFAAIRIGTVDYRVFSAVSGTRHIVVGQRAAARREMAASSALSSLLPVALMLPVLAMVIGLVIRRQLRPLRAAAEQVSRRPPLVLDPLPTAGLPAEVVPLVAEINRLLERLRAAVAHEHRFVADAAHALRTPLAALQLQADVLGGARDPAENASRVGELRAGIRRTVRLADQLLALARAEAPASGRTPLDLIAIETCRLYAPVAAARGVELRWRAQSQATVAGDARELALMLGNLLDNAVRHTAAGGSVVLDARVGAQEAEIEITDEGPGLPEGELERVFERFYRGPGEAAEGSGLGLAVVRSIAERLGGRAWLENRRDRAGLTAHLRLPVLGSLPSAGS